MNVQKLLCAPWFVIGKSVCEGHVFKGWSTCAGETEERKKAKCKTWYLNIGDIRTCGNHLLAPYTERNIVGRQSHFCCWLFAILYKTHINHLFCRGGKFIHTHTHTHATCVHTKKLVNISFRSQFFCTSHEIFGHGSFKQRQQRAYECERVCMYACVCYCIFFTTIHIMMYIYLSLLSALANVNPSTVYKYASGKGRKRASVYLTIRLAIKQHQQQQQ